MADDRAFLHTIMRGLVLRNFPKQECAAREIAEFWAGGPVDHVDVGGFSRKMNGTREWSLFDAFALMQLTGSRRLLEIMGEHLGDPAINNAPPAILAARAAKESGEAVAAALEDGDPANIEQQCREAEEAFRLIRLRRGTAA